MLTPLRLSVVRILLADDHEAVRRGLRALIETQEQWKVCGEAEDGRDAVEKTKTLKPDMVILDISMPTLSGFGAARLIKELCPGTPILVYSMHRSQAFLEEARRIGVTGYISKADDGPTLLMAVDAVQRHRPFFSA
jgi:DNA-binding NarL/FixJ family response regulator